LPPTALTPAQRAHVERRLAVCPQIRGTDLHAELRHDYAYEGSYPAFQRQLRLLRPSVVRDPEVRFETGCAVQTQIDWAHPRCLAAEQPVGAPACDGRHPRYSRAPAIRFATAASTARHATPTPATFRWPRMPTLRRPCAPGQLVQNPIAPA
jgi:hypothetical protein